MDREQTCYDPPSRFTLDTTAEEDDQSREDGGSGEDDGELLSIAAAEVSTGQIREKGARRTQL